MFGLFKPALKPLRLLAQDAEDLALISALTQDAVLRVSDIVYEAKSRAVTLELNRFCHEADKSLRAKSGLRIDNVTCLKVRGFDPKNKDDVLSLLDITAEAKDEIAYTLNLRFAGSHDTDMKVEVEAIDVMLIDVTAPRRVKSKPNHM